MNSIISSIISIIGWTLFKECACLEHGVIVLENKKQ